MKLRPMNGRVVVRPIETSEETGGGIVIPDTAREKPHEGEIVALAEDATEEVAIGGPVSSRFRKKETSRRCGVGRKQAFAIRNNTERKGKMILTVASGKGGTGKTTFSVNLAYALAQRGERVRLLDCDVEEPNDHLFVKPHFTEERDVTVPKPVWDANKCTACGKCAKACHYNAIAVVKKKVLIFNELCHSCGVCTYVCPEGALSERDAKIGIVQAAPGHKPFFFAHGLLNIGEALAPNVVRAVKEHLDPQAINIIDASPGTACPVIEAVRGADAALLVTEPTPFGLNDLKLAVG